MEVTFLLSYDHIQTELPDATTLFSLFAFMHSSGIYLEMVRRGCSEKMTCSENELIDHIRPQQTGLAPRVISIIMDSVRFNAALEMLLKFDLIKRAPSVKGQSAIALHSLVRECTQRRATSDNRKLFWQQQAILLICHAVPLRMGLRPDRADELGNPMLPQVATILDMLDEIGSITGNQTTLITVLLSASYLGDTHFMQRAIDKAKSLLNDGEKDQTLSMMVATRESEMLCDNEDFERSYDVLETHLLEPSAPSDGPVIITPRENSAGGRLLCAYAYALYMDQRNSEALVELQRWKPLNPMMPSPMERCVISELDSLLGDVRAEERSRSARAQPHRPSRMLRMARRIQGHH